MAGKVDLPRDLWYKSRIGEVAKKILQDTIGREGDKPYIVFVDGFGCSGKTVLATALNERLQGLGVLTEVLHVDDFIVQKPIRDDVSSSTLAQNYYEKQFRYDYLKENVLNPMMQGKKGLVSVEIYNHANDDYNRELVNLAPKIAILEGVFLHRPELEGFSDVSIYMSIDRKTQLERAVSRGNNGPDKESILKKYAAKYNPAEDRYLAECDPAKKADILFDTAKRLIVYNTQRFEHNVQRKPETPGVQKKPIIHRGR